jgi:hypothetical protein
MFISLLYNILNWLYFVVRFGVDRFARRKMVHFKNPYQPTQYSVTDHREGILENFSEVHCLRGFRGRLHFFTFRILHVSLKNAETEAPP